MAVIHTLPVEMVLPYGSHDGMCVCEPMRLKEVHEFFEQHHPVSAQSSFINEYYAGALITNDHMKVLTDRYLSFSWCF